MVRIRVSLAFSLLLLLTIGFAFENDAGFSLKAVTTSLAFEQGTSGNVPQRNEIPEKYKWDLSDFYPDTTAWEDDLEQGEREIGREPHPINRHLLWLGAQ